MNTPEGPTESSGNCNSDARLDYAKPALTSFGKVRDLTATGSGSKNENDGKDRGNKAKKMS